MDMSVEIERVRVRTCVAAAQRAPLFITGNGSGAPLHDHRFVVGALHVDIEAALDGTQARRLASQIAHEVALALAAMQARRADQIARAFTTGGPVHVEALRVYLRGEVDRHPPGAQIAAALLRALEDKVAHA